MCVKEEIILNGHSQLKKDVVCLTEPGGVNATVVYGSRPTSSGGLRYILIRLNVFSRVFKIYPLRSATTKACLNKLI